MTSPAQNLDGTAKGRILQSGSAAWAKAAIFGTNGKRRLSWNGSGHRAGRSTSLGRHRAAVAARAAWHSRQGRRAGERRLQTWPLALAAALCPAMGNLYSLKADQAAMREAFGAVVDRTGRLRPLADGAGAGDAHAVAPLPDGALMVVAQGTKHDG